MNGIIVVVMKLAYFKLKNLRVVSKE